MRFDGCVRFEIVEREPDHSPGTQGAETAHVRSGSPPPPSTATRDRWIRLRFRNRQRHSATSAVRFRLRAPGYPGWTSGHSIPDRTGLGCRAASRPSRPGLRPIQEYLSSRPTTSSCFRLAVTRSARSVWTAPAEAPRAEESRGWSSVLAPKRSLWWQRDSDRARWGGSRKSWLRWTSLVNRASFRTPGGMA